MRYVFFLMVIITGAVSCKSNEPVKSLPELSDAELFNRFRKSVVLISAKTYYKVSFEDKAGTVFYFPHLATEGQSAMFQTAEDAMSMTEAAYGTGFFINDEGMIATNLHVVASCEEMISDMDFREEILASIQNQREDVLKYLSYNIDELKRNHPGDSLYLAQQVPERFRNDPPLRYSYLRTEGEDTSAAAYRHKIDSLMALQDKLETTATSKFNIELIAEELNITLDASTGNSNTYECEIVTLAQDKSVDLAIIQTKQKSLPKGVENNIDLDENDYNEYGSLVLPWDTVKVTTPLYLIGYNYGPEIAKTSSGIRVQLTKGQVTQESDDLRVLYSIPALPGSSGSPVFNKQGKVVAVHYCGVMDGDSFNYGILSSYLKQLLEGPEVRTMPL